MSEKFDVSGNLLFVKDSLIQFVSSGKQNVLSFIILIGISPVSIAVAQQIRGVLL